MKKHFPKQIRTLVAVDGSLNNWRWLRKLKEYINLDNCRITLICIAKNSLLKAKAKKFLDISLSLMEDENILYMHEDSVVIIGDPINDILDYAHENNFDFLIVGSHSKTAVERFFMGSVSTNVVNQSHIPVMIMKMS